MYFSVNPNEPVGGCEPELWLSHAASAAKSLQSCLTLCDSIDGSPPVSPIPGTLQARTLKWAAISFSNVKSLSRVRLLATPWTAAYQAPPSMGFSRQEYWSGLPLPSPTKILTHIIYYLCLEDAKNTQIRMTILLSTKNSPSGKIGASRVTRTLIRM